MQSASTSGGHSSSSSVIALPPNACQVDADVGSPPRDVRAPPSVARVLTIPPSCRSMSAQSNHRAPCNHQSKSLVGLLVEGHRKAEGPHLRPFRPKRSCSASFQSRFAHRRTWAPHLFERCHPRGRSSAAGQPSRSKRGRDSSPLLQLHSAASGADGSFCQRPKSLPWGSLQVENQPLLGTGRGSFASPPSSFTRAAPALMSSTSK